MSKVFIFWVLGFVGFSCVAGERGDWSLRSNIEVIDGSTLISLFEQQGVSLTFPYGLNARADKLRWEQQKIVADNKMAIFSLPREGVLSPKNIFDKYVRFFSELGFSEHIGCSAKVGDCGFYFPREVAREADRRLAYEQMPSFWELNYDGFHFYSATLHRGENDFRVLLTVDEKSSEDLTLYAIDLLSVSGEWDVYFVLPEQPTLEQEMNDEGVAELKRVYFAHDSAEILPSSGDGLREIGEFISASSDKIFRVTGHTDNIGTEEYNLKLSGERAEAVVRYLAERIGVNTERVVAEGKGETLPKSNNETIDGRALNRRVELSYEE